MAQFSVSGRAAGGGASETVACLWNPHGSMSLRVWWVSFVYTTAPSAFVSWGLQRATSRGTPATTITPDLDNHNGRRSGPSSGALLDLGNYTTNATLDASVLARCPSSIPVGSGHDWKFPKHIIVPAGTGLALNQITALTLATIDVTFGWDE